MSNKDTDLELDAQAEKTAPSSKQGKKILRVLKRLWRRFLMQSILTKWITLILIVITIAVGVIFFSSVLLWKLFSFVIFKIIINALDWYLEVTEDKANNKKSLQNGS
mgnify:CR=1 FL=1|tara:strand:+ start:29372 stop:29692 length:321 start_codon:yes stop_codon:yes gene_type:complete